MSCHLSDWEQVLFIEFSKRDHPGDIIKAPKCEETSIKELKNSTIGCQRLRQIREYGYLTYDPTSSIPIMDNQS